MIIPDRTFTWFDRESNELKTIELPGLSVVVMSAPKTATSAEADTTPTSTQSEWNRRKILSVVADIMVCLMLLKFVLSWWNHYRAGRINSEASYFVRFGRACASGDAHAIDIALLAWLDRSNLQSLDDHIARDNDSSLAAIVSDLKDQVYAPWNR